MFVLVLDADKQNSKKIKDYACNAHPDWKILVYNTSFALITAIYDEYRGRVDVIFLNISGGMDQNIVLARDIQKFFPHIQVVFYSQCGDCAAEIFIAEPIFFLKLPFEYRQLEEAIKRIEEKYLEASGNMLEISFQMQTIRVGFSSIRYIESEKRKLKIYSDKGAFDTYMTIGNMMKKLPERFRQCHRSYIVNTDRINMYSPDELVLDSGDRIPLSRTYSKQLIVYIRQ